jgi:hypothetical protein
MNAFFSEFQWLRQVPQEFFEELKALSSSKTYQGLLEVQEKSLA